MQRVGPYELLEPIASGGQATVWRGRHVDTGDLAAVKIVRQANADVQEEIRALAMIDHPCVVAIHDTGVVEHGGEAAPTGSAWLSMELADGSLSRRQPRWRELAAATIDVLEALGHVHARGVVHRDLKPDNILLFHSDEDRRYKLGDFGLATKTDPSQDDRKHTLGGTPRYMAPEQIRGHRWAYGPWTDLYALGCTLWRLTTGRAPFEHARVSSLLDQHLYAELPPFVPILAVPPRLDAFLVRLLEKSPGDRFRRAADALDAFRALAGPAQPEATVAERPEHEAPALTLVPDSFEPMTDLVEPPPSADQLPPPSAMVITGQPRSVPGEPPPERPPVRLPTARSSAMAQMRDTPLLGRDEQKQALWAALREASETRATRVVVLRGGPGVGLRRLGEWLASTTHELGLCEVFVAPPVEGRLAALVRSALRARHAGEDQLRLRARALLGAASDPLLVTALVGAAEGVPDDHAPLAAALAAFAGGRVALLWVPSLARDPDFAAWIVRMARQGSHPMLVVISAPTDEPADVALLTDAGARLIDVPPLGRGEVSELLRRRFGLASDVAAVAERIGGGAPRVAIEVVEKWFRDDLLVHERGAWRVADGRTLSVSAPSVSLHAELLQTVCAPLGDADRRVVVAASLLGPEVSDIELAASSPDRDVASVLARLHEADQLARHDEGWTWKSEPARAAARSLVDAATLLEVAAACADAVDAEADPGRAGRLHLDAGACATAAPLLLDGAEKAIDARRLQHGAALLDTWESLRREPGVDGDGETLVRARSLRAVALWERGFTVESGAVREEVVRIARPLGGDALAGALLDKGQLHGASGGSVQETLELLDEALSLVTDPALRRTILHGRVFTRANAGQLEGALADAVEASEIAGPDAERAGSLARVGRLQAMLGRLDEASDTFARALALQDPTDVIDRIRMRQDMAHVHDRRGQDAVALEMMEEALVDARRYAALSDVADLLSNRAEVIRRAGRLDEAEAGYREAMLCLRRLGVQPDAVLVANLALVHLERGEWSRGRELMDRALARVKAEGRPGWTGVLAGLALPAYADDPEALVEALELRASALDLTHHSDRDVYRMMRVAARRLDDLGPPDLARRVREAALAEAEALGMPDLVAEARTALAR